MLSEIRLDTTILIMSAPLRQSYYILFAGCLYAESLWASVNFHLWVTLAAGAFLICLKHSFALVHWADDETISSVGIRRRNSTSVLLMRTSSSSAILEQRWTPLVSVLTEDAIGKRTGRRRR